MGVACPLLRRRYKPLVTARVVSRSQTLYLEKQRGKGLVKLAWQIGSDHATIFEALNWIFEVCANHYGEKSIGVVFSAYSAPQEAS